MLLAALLVAVAQGRCSTPQRPAVVARPAPMDVVILVMDDVAAADLALYGGPVQCPNLESLAAQGMSFSRAYACANCAPTRRAMMTGHWWIAGNGNSCLGDQVTADTPTLDEVFLPEALPHASGLVGKWHLGANPHGGPFERAPEAHGFDHWLAGSPENVSACGGSSYFNWLRVEAGPLAFDSYQETVAYEASACRVSFNTTWPGAPSPKLSVVSPNLAHSPFHVPPLSLLPPGYNLVNSPRGRFEAMIVAWDTNLGMMLSRINLATTLVIVVGDNGTPPGVAPDPDKAKGTVFERGTRVPLVIAGPGVIAGAWEPAVVHAVDIFATVIEAGGGTIPAGSPYQQAGVSLVPLLTGTATVDPHQYVLTGASWGAPDGEAAVVSDTLKLRMIDTNGDRVVNVEELYDLSLDPNESVNRISDPFYAADLAAIRAWFAAEVLPR